MAPFVDRLSCVRHLFAPFVIRLGTNEKAVVFFWLVQHMSTPATKRPRKERAPLTEIKRVEGEALHEMKLHDLQDQCRLRKISLTHLGSKGKLLVALGQTLLVAQVAPVRARKGLPVLRDTDLAAATHDQLVAQIRKMEHDTMKVFDEKTDKAKAYKEMLCRLKGNRVIPFDADDQMMKTVTTFYLTSDKNAHHTTRYGWRQIMKENRRKPLVRREW
jgi:hypothetical protein